MSAKIIQVDRENFSAQQIHSAVESLKTGGVVAFPTETVYGVGVRADLVHAMARLREVKGRQATKAFTLHIADREALDDFVPDQTGLARRLIRKAWPGPLTIIFPVSQPANVPAMKGQPSSTLEALFYDGTIGVRCPDDPIARALLRDAGGPVVAASANFAAQPAPYRGDEVIASLSENVDVIIDAGRTHYTKASTIVRMDSHGCTLIREGVYDAALLDRLAKLRILFVCTGNTCRSPMAEALAQQMIALKIGCEPEDLPGQGIIITSAGTSGGYGGAAEHAIEVMRRRGLNLSDHLSTNLTVEMIQQSDYIFVMTESHRESSIRLAPGAAGRIKLLLGDQDLPDPVGSGVEDYEQCAIAIERALQTVLQEVNP